MRQPFKGIGVIVFIAAAFAMGYALAQSSLDKAVSQAREDLDANATQLNADVASITTEFKQMVQNTNIDFGGSDELHRKIEAKAAAVLVDLETSMVRAHAAILEKTVYNNNLEIEAHSRLTEFFKTDAAFVKSLKEKGITIGGMVVGFGIAKASEKKADDVFAEYEKKRPWAEIAQSFKLKPGDLRRALEGLVPKE